VVLCDELYLFGVESNGVKLSRVSMECYNNLVRAANNFVLGVRVVAHQDWLCGWSGRVFDENVWAIVQ